MFQLKYANISMIFWDFLNRKVSNVDMDIMDWFYIS